MQEIIENRIWKVGGKIEEEELMYLSEKVGNKVMLLKMMYQISHQSSITSCFELFPSTETL